MKQDSDIIRNKGSSKAASDYLHSLGIRGIRYKADTGKSDAYNYVIFNDADIKIEAKYSKDGDIIAFYNPADDTTYFVHDNISKDTSDKDLLGLMQHELSVHALKLGLSDTAFQDVLKRFEAMRKTNPLVKAAFGRVPKDTKPEHVVEEALAYFLEKNPTHTFAQKVIQLIRKALRLIGKALPMAQRAKWIRWANTLSEGDLTSLATEALRSAPVSLQFDNVGHENDSIRLAYEQGIEDVLSGKGKGSLRLGSTSSALVQSGLPNVSLMVTEKVIGKAHFEHGLTKKQLKNLPDLLANPLMVFHSDSQPGSFVAITHEYQQNKPVMVAIKPNGEIERITLVNVITSAYGKPVGVIEGWIKKGLLISSDKKAALAFASTNGLRLPAVVQSIRKSLSLNIAQPDKNSSPFKSAPQQRFYSALRKAFRDAPGEIFDNPVKVKMWLNSNRAAKFDVKKDEIYWSGINDWLDMQTGEISKDDVLSYLDQNGAKVEDVVLGDKTPDHYPDNSYMHPETGNVDTLEGWRSNTDGYSDDGGESVDEQLDSLIDVSGDLIGEDSDYVDTKHNTSSLTCEGTEGMR